MSNLVPIYVDKQELQRIEDVLKTLGFKEILLQEWKEEQIIGLAKDVTSNEINHLTNNQNAAIIFPRCQWHLRGYRNGKLEMEIEIHRDDFRHLWSTRPSAHNDLALLLSEMGVQYKLGSTSGPTDPIDSLKYFPLEYEIDWKTALIVVGIGVLLVVLYRRLSK